MRTKERIKTILLLVLLFGAVSLTYLNWTSYTGKNDTYDANEATLNTSVAKQNMATPFSVSYKTDEGRFGAAYHGGSVNALYDKLRPYIAEALSGNMHETSEVFWISALDKKGVLIDYEGNIPAFALASDLGSDAVMPDVYCRYLLITEDNIYLKDTQREVYHVITHKLGEKWLDGALFGLNATKCTLAYEAKNTRVSFETLMFDRNISSFTINSVNSQTTFGDSQLSALLKVFGMNYNTCGRHIEKDGSKVYIEDLSTLKISPDGYVTFESEDASELSLSIPSQGEKPTVQEIVEGAGSIVDMLCSFAGGDASLYLREVYEEGTIKYGRSFGGIPIDKSGSGYAAEVYLSGNKVVRLGFHMRGYTATATATYTLPQKFAIASVDEGNFGVLSLRYNDNSLGTCEALWYVKK
ncbi:MAG: hypothetical protein IKU84_06340 [Clostridia bacterium]|nr:hypothetical protein [Clostridia bacterium]